MGMGNLQRMAQQMQQEMLRIQSELETTIVDGSAGGGVVRATATGKQELVSVTIDPSAVDPDDVEMLQDLVVAAVNDALRASREIAEQKMSAVTGGLRLPGCRPALTSPVIEPVARLIEAFSRLPGIGPKTAQRLTFHLLRAQDAEARTLAAALDRRPRPGRLLRPLLQHQRPAALPDLSRSRARPDPAVRRRGAARRPCARTDRRVQGPLPRPPRRDLADRRDRPRPAPDPRAARARRRGRARGDAVRRGHHGHQPDPRG